jgi:hypothetical protein
MSGLLIRFVNGAAMAEARLGGVSLSGIAAAGFVAAALIPAGVVSLRQAWMRIAVRVAGSWIVALGLLMVAWSVKAAGGCQDRKREVTLARMGVSSDIGPCRTALRL